MKLRNLSVALLSAGLLSFQLAPAQAAAPAKPAAAAPVTKVTSVEGLTEYRLANGLRVLLFPDASKPTLTTNVVYFVGSRHENYGETGMAHLLEHLLFKPSANFGVKKGSKTPVDVLNMVGGEFNGTTWYDRTNYFSTFPANDDNLKLMLAMEADRMVNAAIDQNDLWNPKTNKGEMTVVRNEFESGESNPVRVTLQRMQSIAYDWHNYGKSTIGARSDIEQVNIPRLRAFYKTYYQPDNAVLMIAGRFDEAKVLQQIVQSFGKIPKPSRVIQPTYTSEPVQDGERSVVVRRVGGTQFVGAGYHIAPGAHADAAAIDALDRILVDAPSGRLHKALVETKLATQLFARDITNLEPSFRIYGAIVPKDGNLDAAQDALLKTLEGLKAQPITQAELDRAKQELLKNIELAMNDTASLSIGLTEALAAGDWRLFFIGRDRVEKLDLATVQAAANTYYKSSNRTLGRFTPTDAADRAEIPATPDIRALVDGYQGRAVVAQGEAFDPSPDNIEKRTQRSVLPNGMQLALLPKKTKGETVSLALALRLGSEAALRGKAQVGGLTSASLMMGTDKLSRQEIKDAFDKLKAQVNVGGGAEGVTATITTTRPNLAPALDLLVQVLTRPSFPAKEVGEQQLARISQIEQSMTEPQPLAIQALNRMTDETPVGHVRHAQTFAEKLASLKALTVDDVKSFHQNFYGAASANFSAVGDFDAAALKAQLTSLLGNWKAAQPYARVPASVKPVSAERVKIETPDKANSMMLVIQPLAIKDSAANYPALVLANHMIGGGALKSRLADRIRQKEGLSYGVGSQLSVPAEDPAGLWLAYTISAPQNTAKVEAALREEMQKVLAEGFNAAELAEAKKAWRQGEEVGRTDDAALSMRLARYLGYARTMAYDKDLEAKVEALTLEQVNAALKAAVSVDKLSVIAAGDFEGAAKKAAK